MSQETPYFPGHQKPEHVGVYKRKVVLNVSVTFHFSRWDGEAWCSYDTDPEVAALQTQHSFEQHLPWCGLTEPQS